MGFGSLFIGYFLILNMTYYTFTDLISALIMLLGFYKLININKSFRLALIPTAVFAVIGALELVTGFIKMFFPTFNDGIILDYTTPTRYVAICLISTLMLLGIKDVANEVGLKKLSAKAASSIPFCYGIFAVLTVLEFPFIESFVTTKTIATVAVFALLIAFSVIMVNLSTIYGAYMRICMPEDKDNDIKPSRFGFVNKMRAHEAKKQQEYADYQQEKLMNKIKKNKRK